MSHNHRANHGAIVESLEKRALLSGVMHPLTDPAVRFTSANHQTFQAGQAMTFNVTTSGFAGGTLGESGILPASLTFTPDDNGGATIAGDPAAGAGGTYSLVLSAGTVLQGFTLTVDQPLTFTTANNATFATGGTNTFSIQAGGFPTPLISESGALPRGLRFERMGNATAEIAGTPANRTGGTYQLTFTAKDGSQADAVQDFTLTVDQPAQITSDKKTAFVIGLPSTFTVTTSGPPTATTIQETGDLPSGVIFINNGDGTATLAGTPTVPLGAIYTLTLAATNGIGNPAVQIFTLEVDQAPAITSANSLTLTAGVPADFTVTTTGFPAPLFDRADLPRGLRLHDNRDGTANLYGAPARSDTAHTYLVTFDAHNGVPSDATQTFTLTIEQGPTFTSPDRLHIVSGVPYSFSFTTDGFPAASFAESGALPPALSFTDNHNGTASLTGPLSQDTTGTYELHIVATNGISSAAQTFILTVN